MTATSLPEVAWGEVFFEVVDWFAAAVDARGTYTMVTLGACYGSQAVGAYLALQGLESDALPTSLPSRPSQGTSSG